MKNLFHIIIFYPNSGYFTLKFIFSFFLLSICVFYFTYKPISPSISTTRDTHLAHANWEESANRDIQQLVASSTSSSIHSADVVELEKIALAFDQAEEAYYTEIRNIHTTNIDASQASVVIRQN